jgi:hypothetical protein
VWLAGHQARVGAVWRSQVESLVAALASAMAAAAATAAAGSERQVQEAVAQLWAVVASGGERLTEAAVKAGAVPLLLALLAEGQVRAVGLGPRVRLGQGVWGRASKGAARIRRARGRVLCCVEGFTARRAAFWPRLSLLVASFGAVAVAAAPADAGAGGGACAGCAGGGV